MAPKRKGIGLVLMCLVVAGCFTWIIDYCLQVRRRRHQNDRINFLAKTGIHLEPSFTFPGFEIQTWMEQKLEIGTPARDFTLPNAVDGREVRLADLRKDKPVVLIFGSFGCNLFCAQSGKLRKLYQAYKDRAEFVFIYVEEGPHMEVLPALSPKEDPLHRIRRGLRHFQVPFSCLLANNDAALQEAYDTFPARLVIVNPEGRIALDSGRIVRSQGWDLAQVEAWLKNHPRVH